MNSVPELRRELAIRKAQVDLDIFKVWAYLMLKHIVRYSLTSLGEEIGYHPTYLQNYLLSNHPINYDFDIVLVKISGESDEAFQYTIASQNVEALLFYEWQINHNPYVHRLYESCLVSSLISQRRLNVEKSSRLVEQILPVSKTRKTPQKKNSKSRAKTSVYFIANEFNSTVKIGFSVDVGIRLRNLQIGCSTPLSLLKTIEGGRQLEKQLHQRFKHLHVTGEWFLLTPELITFINEL